MTVDFKKLVGNLFHAKCTLVASKSIKRKTRLSGEPRIITTASKLFHMQYRSTFQCISRPGEITGQHCKPNIIVLVLIATCLDWPWLVTKKQTI